jgi:ATP-binding cassette subfamily A (ABC1) protein 3
LLSGYYREGFLAIQRAIDLSIMSEWDPTAATDTINIELKRHPYPPYSDDTYVNILQTQFPFIVMLSFIVAAPNISKDICLEKEKKLKVCLQEYNEYTLTMNRLRLHGS